MNRRLRIKVRVSKGAVALLLFAFLFSVLTFFDSVHREHIGPCTVVAKRVENPDEGDDRKTVETLQCGDMRVGGTLAGWSFHLGDIYNDIHVGSTYLFVTQGFLAEAVHGRPNIIDLLEINP